MSNKIKQMPQGKGKTPGSRFTYKDAYEEAKKKYDSLYETIKMCLRGEALVRLTKEGALEFAYPNNPPQPQGTQEVPPTSPVDEAVSETEKE